MDWIEPFLPIVQTDPGMNQGELERAATAALQRQKVLEDVLTGKRPEDDFNDLLRMEGWDPDAYWQTAEANVEAFIRAGIVPEALEFLDCGLVIPRRENA